MRLSLRVVRTTCSIGQELGAGETFCSCWLLVGKAHTHTVSSLALWSVALWAEASQLGLSVTQFQEPDVRAKWLPPLAANLNHTESLKN